MLLGVPVVLVALPAVYLVLTRIMFTLDARELPGMAELITAEKAAQGRMGRGELTVAVVFVLTAGCWVFRPLIASAVPLVSDTTVAMAGALLLFMIPVDLRRGDFVMNWEATKALPWGVLLLFGGGLSLAGNIERHGLATYLGNLAMGIGDMPLIFILCAICFGVLMQTEVTSNTATAATFLPIGGALAVSGVVARIVPGPHEAHRQDPHRPMRYNTGRPRAVIRLRISQPMTASLPCPAGLRGRCCMNTRCG